MNKKSILMKLVTAIIDETRLDAVREALIQADIVRITVVRVSGHGQQRNEEIYRGKKFTPNLIAKVKIEIALNDEFVDAAVEAIIKAAKSVSGGNGGDGKIFIVPLEECIRIRTNERGGKGI